jgi:hypothetical protein
MEAFPAGIMLAAAGFFSVAILLDSAIPATVKECREDVRLESTGFMRKAGSKKAIMFPGKHYQAF